MSQDSLPKGTVQGANNNKGVGRKLAIGVIVALVLAGAGIGTMYYLYAQTHKSTDDAFIDGHITQIAARVPGHVVKVLVEDNQWVKEGDLLVELDPSDYEAKLAQAAGALQMAESAQKSAQMSHKVVSVSAYATQEEATSGVKLAEAAVETAKSQVEQAKAGVAVADASVEQAQAETGAMKAQADLDELDLKRYAEMYEGKAVTKQQLDQATAQSTASKAKLAAAEKRVAAAQSQATQARAAVKTAEEALHQAESSLGQANARLTSAKSAPDRVGQAEAQVHVTEGEVAQATAAVQQAKLALGYTKVYAPRAGRVSEETVRAGSYVQVGQSLLALVPAEMWVTANYKETELTKMRPGQPVEIRVDAYPDLVLKGHVDSIQAGTGAVFSLLPPENATGNYIKVVQRVPVKIVFDEKIDLERYHIAPGMSVVPTVDVSGEGTGSKK